jgi:hypothetical protein
VVLLIVWIAVAVLAVVVLGGILYGLMGALGRLRGELQALDREVRPVLEQVQEALARTAQSAERRSTNP